MEMLQEIKSLLCNDGTELLRIQYTKFSSFSFSLGFDLCLKQSHCMLMVHVVAIRV